MISLAGTALATAGVDGAKPAGKKPRAVPYRLSFRYTGANEFISDVGKADSRAEFAGTTKRFWLIRSGTASKPVYTIASADKRTPEYLWPTIAIAFTGKTHFQFTNGCTYDGTFRLSDSEGHVEIFMSKNNLGTNISHDGRYVRRIAGCWCDPNSETEPCPHGLNQPVWPSLPLNGWGENEGNRRNLWIKQVRFGQRFTIHDIHDCISFPRDPNCWHSPGIDERQSWHWVLTFIPA